MTTDSEERRSNGVGVYILAIPSREDGYARAKPGREMVKSGSDLTDAAGSTHFPCQLVTLPVVVGSNSSCSVGKRMRGYQWLCQVQGCQIHGQVCATWDHVPRSLSNGRHSIVIVHISLLLPLILPVVANLPHRFRDLLVLFIFRLVPFHIVFAGDLLDLLPVSIRFFDQRLPSVVIESFRLIEFVLAPRDGQVHGGAVGDFSVVVEEPQVAANQRGQTDQVLV